MPWLGWLSILIWCLGLAIWPHPACAVSGESCQAFELNGNIRTLLFVLDAERADPFSRRPDFDALSQTTLRLTAQGRPCPALSYEIHWVDTVTWSSSSSLGGPFNSSTLFGDASRYRAFEGKWRVEDGEHLTSEVFFDRFNLKAELGWGDVTAGRQAITFGKAYFWNPLDVFFPFDASQFDREYKPGFDALRLDLPFGLLSGANLVVSPGPRLGTRQVDQVSNDPWDVNWFGSAILGRLFANHRGWDVAVQGGKVFGGWQVGAATVGDLGPLQVRGELAWFWALESDPLPPPLSGDLMEDNLVVVVGAGHRFDNSLTLDLEYLYNGAGDPDHLTAALIRTQFGASLQMGTHLLGLLLRYEFLPILVGQVATISSLSDGSIQLQPILTASLSDEMELLAGLGIHIGEGLQRGAGSCRRFAANSALFLTPSLWNGNTTSDAPRWKNATWFSQALPGCTGGGVCSPP
jgi:hypothetical protein